MPGYLKVTEGIPGSSENASLNNFASRNHQSCWINQQIIASEYRDHPLIVFQSYLLRFGV